MLHGREPDSLPVAQAALDAAMALEVERADLYTDMVLASVDETARAILEAIMASGNYQYQSDFAQRHFGRGKAEGEAAGRAHALFTVLQARGLDVPDDVRAQITACSDLTRLDAWLARAVTAASAVDVVRE